MIFPGKYTYTLREPAEWAKHALEDLDPSFAANVQPGDIIVGGKNWGSGSSREQAVGCLKAAGVQAIVAASFARIFFRNAVNNGLLPVVCPEAVAAIEPGETIGIDLDRCVVICAAGEFAFPPLSDSLRAIVAAGGLIEMLKDQTHANHLSHPWRRRRPGSDPCSGACAGCGCAGFGVCRSRGRLELLRAARHGLARGDASRGGRGGWHALWRDAIADQPPLPALPLRGGGSQTLCKGKG